MSRRQIGWLFVVIQFLLLAALVLLPSGDDWSRPGWLQLLSTVVFVAGLAIVAAAALGLGPALTATPVPTAGGHLVTGGLFRFARHPIYTGVLLVVTAVAVRSGSVVTVAVAVVTIAFFWVKSSWEEVQLRRTYPDYDHYAAVTGRFFPRLGRARTRS
ncbi:MAG: methyltransferase [Actinomycetota bacterium]